MPSDGRENALGAPVALPRRALAGSAAAKALEALTLAGLVLLVPRALGAADYGRFAVALAAAGALAFGTVAAFALPDAGASGATAAMLAGVVVTIGATFAALRRSRSGAR